MQTNDIFWLLFSLLAGILLGWFFFLGLRLTVEQLPKVKHPWLLMLASYLMRTLFIVIAFYFIMDGNLFRLLACLVGFIIARTVLIRRTNKQPLS